MRFFIRVNILLYVSRATYAADLWLSDAPWAEVKHLQRSLGEGELKLVAKDAKTDLAVPT